MGRCITDYMRRSVGFEIADTEGVSPLVQNKKRLDHIVMRLGVFVADMTCIALRSKIKSKTCGSDSTWFSVRFWIAKTCWFVRVTNARQKLAQDTIKTESKGEQGRSQSIDYIYKSQIGCYIYNLF